jgi:hypothetical protein
MTVIVKVVGNRAISLIAALHFRRDASGEERVEAGRSSFSGPACGARMSVRRRRDFAPTTPRKRGR